MNPLPSPRQQAVLDFIREYRHKTGIAPTMQEIGDGIGCTKVTVFEIVGNLERKRLIRRTPHAARSIELVDDAPVKRRLVFPVLGWVRLTR